MSTPRNTHWKIEEATELGVWTVYFTSLFAIVYFIGIDKLNVLIKIATGHRLPRIRTLRVGVIPLFFSTAVLILPIAAIVSSVQSPFDLCSFAVLMIFLSHILGSLFPMKDHVPYFNMALE